MRLFVGLRPSDTFRTALSAVQCRLREAGVAAAYLDPSNLHLTLAFIGQWPDNIAGILPAVERPFCLKLSHPGLFPEARVIWAGVEPSAELNRLAEQVRSTLREAEIPFDPKPFVPHITLGRKPAVPEGLRLSEIKIPPAVMTVTEVFLYRSDRGENGMVYSVIGSGAGKTEAFYSGCSHSGASAADGSDGSACSGAENSSVTISSALFSCSKDT